jgi:uncharacterized protein
VKYFLLLVFALAVYWFIKRNRTRDAGGDEPERPAEPPAAEPMVRCAHCGVHLPRNEAVADGERLYCSEQHLRLARPPE